MVPWQWGTAKSVLLAPSSLAGYQPQDNLRVSWRHTFSCSISLSENNQRNASHIWLLEFLALLGVFHSSVVSCTAAAKVICHVSPLSDLFEAEDSRLFPTTHSQCTGPWLSLCSWWGPAGSSDLGLGTDILPGLGSAALHGAEERTQRKFLIILYILFKYAKVLESCVLASGTKEEQGGFAC